MSKEGKKNKRICHHTCKETMTHTASKVVDAKGRLSVPLTAVHEAEE